MRLEDMFIEIGKEEECEPIVEESKYWAEFGSVDFQNYYGFKIKYKSESFKVENLLGAQSYGRIELMIDAPVNIYPFTIITKDHFSALFSFKKERVRIKSPDEKFATFLNKMEPLNRLRNIVSETRFCPSISGRLRDNKFEVITEYDLAFPERNEVLKPLINFYKIIIDKAKDRS